MQTPKNLRTWLALSHFPQEHPVQLQTYLLQHLATCLALADGAHNTHSPCFSNQVALAHNERILAARFAVACEPTSAQPTSPNHWSDFVKTKRSRLCRSPRSSMAWLFCSSLSILSFKGSLLASARQITMEFGFFSSSVTISTIALFTPLSSGLLPSLARTPGKSMMRLGVSHFSVSMVIKIFSFSGVLVFFLAHQLNSWHKADSPPISGKRHKQVEQLLCCSQLQCEFLTLIILYNLTWRQVLASLVGSPASFGAPLHLEHLSRSQVRIWHHLGAPQSPWWCLR